MFMTSRAVVTATSVMRFSGFLIVSRVTIWSDMASCTGTRSYTVRMQHSDINLGSSCMAITAIGSRIERDVVARHST